MFNNIYDKIKDFMKDYLGIIIFIGIFLFLTFYEIPYDVNMPGGLISLNDRIEVDGKKKKVEIEGIHIKEDTCKSAHRGEKTLRWAFFCCSFFPKRLSRFHLGIGIPLEWRNEHERNAKRSHQADAIPATGLCSDRP